ncbi:MAG: D-alanyl-D-alanine carboxypeptidase/D-alanyl-D-alanine-endopeptidase [Vulcanimicrobiota bacterium]
MKLRVLSVLFFFAAACWPGLAQGTPASGKDFNRAATAVVKGFEQQYGGKVGVSTQVLKSGKVPFSYNGTSPMIPASNLKLVTTAVALDVLGPDYRFETRLYGPSASTGGVLEGDLVLKGAGDPTFFPPYVDSSTAPFASMADVLKRNGVNRVTGDLVVDDSDFDREFISSAYHSRYLLSGYAASVAGIGLNQNVVTVSVGSNGVSTDPPTGSLEFINKVKIGGNNQIWAERPRNSDRITLHGFVAPGSTAQTTITIFDPVRMAASVCFRVLTNKNIRIDGKWRLVPEGEPASLANKVLIARHRSPKLVELLEATNVDSNNLFAQHIFRRLGANVVGLGNVRNSEAVVRDFFKRKNISDVGLRMDDGSGLSERNRIAPFQLVYLLKAMWDHPQGQLFIDTLPAAGEGTMRSRLGGSVVRAKTGTLNNHSGLSGYVVTAYGETVGFSILVNDVDITWPAVDLQDELVAMLARWDRPL